MQEPPVPAHEAQRLAALQALQILDTPAEERFDRYARLAQQILNVPIAVVSLVDRNRQWFKSCLGLAAKETPRSISFCGHAILEDQLLVIPDALNDQRFADNPLVVGEPHIRFYAGAQLKLSNGHCIGTLCVIDRHPRQMSVEQLAALRDLAQCVSDEMELRQKMACAAEESIFHARYSAIIQNADDAIVSTTLDGAIETWNPAAEKLFGYRATEAVGMAMTVLMPVDRREEELLILVRIRRGEYIGQFETVRMRKDGQMIQVSISASPILDDRGNVVGASKIVRDLTQQKKNELALFSINNLNQAVINGTDHLIITTDTQGVILSFNKAAERNLGYRAEELIGKLTPAVFHDLDEVVRRAEGLNAQGIEVRPGFEVFVVIAKRQAVGDTYEWTYVRKDGSRFPVQLTVSALRNEVGEVTAYLGVASDITERTKAVKEKQENEALLKEAQHIAKLGSWELNLQTGKLMWSDEIYNLFEIDKEKFGATYAAFLSAIHPDDRAIVNDAYAASLVNHAPYEITHRLLMNDGRIKWVHEHCVSEFGQDGKPLNSRGTVQDFTALKAAEDAVKESAARTQAILNNVLDGIITIGERGTIESFNKAAEKIFGYAAEEVIARNVKMLMPEPYQSEHDGYLNNFLTTGKKKIIGIGRQVTGRRKNGSSFPMDLAVSEMYLGEKRVFTGVVRDITSRVQIERMKREFISTVSHELRTPLTSIRGSLALIVGGVVGELPAPVKPLIEIAHKNCERLILLVNDILDMEKIEAGKMEFDIKTFNLMDLLHQALEGNRAYGAQFNISYELRSELPELTVRADENRLMQVFANLLSNAAKFSHEGGKVIVALARMGPLVRITVQDNGTGISAEFKSHIFQKFAQADSSDTRKKGGTGLGLSITKAIVEQMGGHIGFTSQPNVLTTFYVDLPLWKEPQANGANLVDAMMGRRVLICEDDHDVAAALRLVLEQEGLVADVASNAAQAKQLLAHKNYAVMTLDLAMQNQEGVSLIRELRVNKKTANLPIVVISAFIAEGREQLDGEAFSVIDWIAKPIDRKQLVEALNHALFMTANARAKVLHVEDDYDVAHVVGAIVGEVAEITHVTTVEHARQLLMHEHFDLAIIDLSLPDG